MSTFNMNTCRDGYTREEFDSVGVFLHNNVDIDCELPVGHYSIVLSELVMN